MKAILAGVEVEVVEVVPGFQVVSTLAHPLVFTDGGRLEPNPELVQVVKATIDEIVVATTGDVTLVHPMPKPEPEALSALQAFAASYPEVRVVSSALSVDAFREALPGLVISPITTPETSRLPINEKRVHRNKWNA